MKKYIKKNQKNILISKAIFIILGVFLLMINDNFTITKLMAIFSVLLLCIMTFRMRNNWLLFIFFAFILYGTLSIVLANYFGIVENFFTSFSSDDVSIKAINILFFFILGLYIIQPNVIKKTNEIKLFSENKKNNFISIGLCIILLLIFIFAYKKPANLNDRGQISTIYEYSVILFIIAYSYTNRKSITNLITVIAVIFIIKDTVYGGRITSIQLILTVFVILLSKKIKPIQVMPLFLLILVIYTGIGTYRAEFELSFDSILNIFHNLLENGFVNDTSYSAYYTSLTFVKIVSDYSFIERLSLFLCFLLSMFFGSKIPLSNLAIISREKYVHYFGGVLPFFFYFYLGFFGIILILLYLNYWLKRINNIQLENNTLIQIIGIYVVVTVPRWFLYSPSTLIRGVMIVIIIFSILNYLNKNIGKEKKIK